MEYVVVEKGIIQEQSDYVLVFHLDWLKDMNNEALEDMHHDAIEVGLPSLIERVEQETIRRQM